MNIPSCRLAHFGSVMLFPLAIMIYDLSAYLTTDMIQPGIIDIFNELQAEVKLAPMSISIYMLGGLALHWLLGPLSDRIGRRPVLLSGVIIFAFSCLSMLFVTTIEQYLIARFIQGTSICFIPTVGYVAIQEAFGENNSIRIMAVLTSIVLFAPVVGPVAGAALMTIIHWRVLFLIISSVGFFVWVLLYIRMPETVNLKRRGFNIREVLSDFKIALKNPVVLAGSLSVALGNIPIISWVAISPLILIEQGSMSSGDYALTQVPIFGGIIIGSVIIANFIEEPTSPRYMRRTILIQFTGLMISLIGNILYPHIWLWSIMGTSIYAFGIGLLNPVLYRLTLFKHDLPRGTVSATMNIILLTTFTISVEIIRWIYILIDSKIVIHIVSLITVILVMLQVSRLVKIIRL